MRLIANCQLAGDYGVVNTGQSFIVLDADAQKLLDSGAARRADPPRVLYQTKPRVFETPTIQPEAPEVSARPPFRNVSLSNAQSPPVASASDRVLPKSDLPAQGVPDPGRRGRREGSDSSR